MKKRIAYFILVLIFINSIFSVSLSDLMIVADDGTFLGNFTNEYNPKSVYNNYGDYGSKYNPNSIFNQYGTYGSDYSIYSPFNKYSNNGPWLMDRYGNYYGRLSINRYAQDVTDYSYRLAYQLKAMRDSM